MAATVARVLADTFEVRLRHHLRELDGETLSSFSGVDLRDVRVEFVPDRMRAAATARSPWEYWYREYCRGRELADGADCFITITHEPPPLNVARHGLCIVLFPSSDYLHAWPFSPPEVRSWRGWLVKPWRWLFRRVWRAQMGSYASFHAISGYTSYWLGRWWEVQSHLLYPPVSLLAAREEDQPGTSRIAAVGRFSTKGVSKRQRELVAGFERIRYRLPGWTFACVGALADDPDDQRYYAEVERSAGPRTEVVANPTRPWLEALLRGASIFWHAAGADIESDARPELAEHFGMVIVEAMSAGCVPVVIGVAGPAEIVEHEVSGFVCQDLDEMMEYTVRLASDAILLERMSRAARRRAEQFSVEAFGRRLRHALQQVGCVA